MGELTWILQREVILQAVEFFIEVNRCKNDSMPIDIVSLCVKNALVRLPKQVLKETKLAWIKGKIFLRIWNR